MEKSLKDLLEAITKSVVEQTVAHLASTGKLVGASAVAAAGAAAETVLNEKEAEDDLLGPSDVPEPPALPTLTDLQDAIREAAGKNKEKAKAVIGKFKKKDGKPAERGSEILEADYAKAIELLGKVK